MKRFAIVTGGLVTWLFSAGARAQDRPFQLGLRTGYAFPMGSAYGAQNINGTQTSDAKMSDSYSGQIPIWLDVGYLVTPQILVGIYAQYGFVSIKNAASAGSGAIGCGSGFDCSASNLRLGVQGQYHFNQGAAIDPWLGLGLGYEVLHNSLKGSVATGFGTFSIDAKANFKGWEFANLQGGADFKVAEGLAVGPFASFAFGKYSSVHIENSGQTQDQDLSPTTVHEWLLLGAKGSFGL